ncbi:MAG: glycosyltransferase family 2 protein, partial [Paludibacteraceae bacterium]|nr:glycosyltransferase family 2 protein [Paludibacteraceae bacterium]
MRYCAVIPIYNNSKTISKVAKSVTQFVDRVYVVDDGSDEETKSVLTELSSQEDGIKILTLSVNSGKGKALTTGFAEAYADGYDYAVALDADGQHFADDIPVLIAKVSDEKPTLVCGVRNITTQENMPSKNTFANKFSNFWFKV